jgi:hypothetical protein
MRFWDPLPAEALVPLLNELPLARGSEVFDTLGRWRGI